jgi:hypothetical protein
MSKPSDPKSWSSDPLLILIAALLLFAVVATVYFAFNGPAKEFTHEPAPRPRPIIQDEPHVVVVTKAVAGGHGAPMAEAAGHAAPEAKPAETKPAEKPAEPAAVTVAAPVVKPSADGKVHGKVVLKGTPLPEKPIGAAKSDANCGKYHPDAAPTTRNYMAAADGGLRNALVRIVNAPAGAGKAAGEMLIDQTGCMYEPYVSAVLAGQPFKIRNSDPILQNINATPKLNKGFNFAQATAGQVNEKTFDKPELAVRFTCNVHPWMIAYVNVLENPFFAVTDEKGEFVLPDGLPPGKYTLEVNHLKAGVASAEIEVAAGKGAEVTFELGVK